MGSSEHPGRRANGPPEVRAGCLHLRGKSLRAVASGALCPTAIAGWWSGVLDISWPEILICLACCALLSGFAHSIYTFASRHVPAAEITLLSLVEMIASPFWVWLVMDETPTGYTLIGGAVVAADSFRALLDQAKRETIAAIQSDAARGGPMAHLS